MGTSACYDSEDKPNRNTVALQQKYADLQQQYQSERNQKSQLITKIQESAQKYDELINSQRSLNQEYDKEIVKSRRKSMDLEKSLNSAEITKETNPKFDEYKSRIANHNYEEYKDEITQLSEQISKQNTENLKLKHAKTLLQTQITQLSKPKKSKRKNRYSIIAQNMPNITEKNMELIETLKKEINSLKSELRETETNEANVLEQRVKDTMRASMKVTDVSAFIKCKYKTPDCSDKLSETNSSKLSYANMNEPDDEFNLDWDNGEDVELPPSNKMYRNTSVDAWGKQDLIQYKQEMEQQMVSLIEQNKNDGLTPINE